MNAYRIYLADGTDYVTSMNATLAEARAYLCNREINTGAAEDNMVRVQHVDHADSTKTIKCPHCGMDSGTAHWHKANAWWRCHVALTCRGVIRTQEPCVNLDEQEETTHEDEAPEYQPCPICKATDPNFDGYCQQCEIQLERKTNTTP